MSASACNRVAWLEYLSLFQKVSRSKREGACALAAGGGGKSSDPQVSVLCYLKS